MNGSTAHTSRAVNMARDYHRQCMNDGGRNESSLLEVGFSITVLFSLFVAKNHFCSSSSKKKFSISEF